MLQDREKIGCTPHTPGALQISAVMCSGYEKGMGINMNILKNIKETAALHGERVAVKSKEGELTYAQLEEYSNKLAVWLKGNYKNSKTPVVVYGHKNPYMLVCFLACVKSGRGYCPQDLSIPMIRVIDTIESVNPDVIFQVEGELALTDYQTTNLFDIKTIIEDTKDTYDESWQNAPEDVHYIIFTSGSTGKPKGVQITTECLNNYLDWSVTLAGDKAKGIEGCRQEKEGMYFLNQAPFSFDLSVMDLYTSLACGGTLVTMDKETQKDYGKMFSFFEKEHLNIWVSTPSFADMCMSDKKFSKELLPDIKAFLFCGETLTTSTVEHLMERFPGAKIINTYGPTESTVAVTDVEITKEMLGQTIAEGKSLPVGHEKPGTFIEIHDEDGKCVKEGEQGEIVIIGDTVSIGYYQRADLTEKHFFTCERNGVTYRAYHTGDAGYLKDGQLFYNGRIDLQVKLHGYRIEIEDIENNMVRLPQITHAVVIPNIKEGKVKSLTAFVTGEKTEQSPLEYSKEIKEGLKEILPAYMIPKKIRYIDSIPMNNHGKADRKYLGGLLA